MLKIDLNENEKKEIIDELLNILTKENEQKLLDDLTDEDKRWLLNNLMLMRTMGYLDENFLHKQDSLLSYENRLGGVVNPTDFKFKKNIAFYNENITKLSVDAIIIFSSNLFGRLDNYIKCLDNTILLHAGLQVNEDLAFKLKSNNGLIDYTVPYIIEGYNLPAKNIVKIMLREIYGNFLDSDKERLKLVLNNLFQEIKELHWKTIAIGIYDFPMNYPLELMKNIITNEFQRLNKQYKTKLNMIFVE